MRNHEFFLITSAKRFVAFRVKQYGRLVEKHDFLIMTDNSPDDLSKFYKILKSELPIYIYIYIYIYIFYARKGIKPLN